MTQFHLSSIVCCVKCGSFQMVAKLSHKTTRGEKGWRHPVLHVLAGNAENVVKHSDLWDCGSWFIQNSQHKLCLKFDCRFWVALPKWFLFGVWYFAKWSPRRLGSNSFKVDVVEINFKYWAFKIILSDIFTLMRNSCSKDFSTYFNYI